MATREVEPEDAKIPGWKIERSYKPGTLLPESSEPESKNVIKCLRNTIYRTEHRPYYAGTDVIASDDATGKESQFEAKFRSCGGKWGPFGPPSDAGQRELPTNYHHVKPDEMPGRKRAVGPMGLTPEQFFYHHGNRYLSNYVTSYEEDFNGRWREKNLPAFRVYDQHSKTWVPEKRDVVVQEPPTNFGLVSLLRKRWEECVADSGDYRTTYSTSYRPYSVSQTPATHQPGLPQSGGMESSTLHPFNTTLRTRTTTATSITRRPDQHAVPARAQMTHVSI